LYPPTTTSRPPSTPLPPPGKCRVARVRVKVAAASVVSDDVPGAIFGKTRQVGGLCNVCNVHHAEKKPQENLARICFLKFKVLVAVSILCDLLLTCKPPPTQPPSALCRSRGWGLLELL
jgi:hypothetical protein